MKRLTLFFAMFAAILITAAPALAINLHNGLIIIQNKTSYILEISIQHHFFNGRNIDEKIRIPVGGVYETKGCCYAAGSEYELSAQRLGMAAGQSSENWYHAFLFKPKLCNRNAIPYGYAVIEILPGRIYKIPEQEVGCYEGPL